MVDLILIVCLIVVIASFIEQIMAAVAIGGVCIVAALFLTGNASPAAWHYLEMGSVLGFTVISLLVPALLIRFGVFLYKHTAKGKHRAAHR
jgi:1,4-dihydroxy-2-naphthoate octaprenyltransferase